MLSKMSRYVISFDEAKYMLFKDDELLQKTIKPGIKSAIVLKEWLDSKPVYNEKYLKTKIKSDKSKLNWDFMII